MVGEPMCPGGVPMAGLGRFRGAELPGLTELAGPVSHVAFHEAGNRTHRKQCILAKKLTIWLKAIYI